jgi:hypothetical protein
MTGNLAVTANYFQEITGQALVDKEELERVKAANEIIRPLYPKEDELSTVELIKTPQSRIFAS